LARPIVGPRWAANTAALIKLRHPLRTRRLADVFNSSHTPSMTERNRILGQAAERALAPIFVLWRRPWIAAIVLLAVLVLSGPLNLGAEWLAAATALAAFAYVLPHSRSPR
jgi:hypothetical protein